MLNHNALKPAALFSDIAVYFLGLALACTLASAETPTLPKRISSRNVDLGRVHRVYMVPGMATMIEIPGPVTGIRMGNPEEISYFRPDKPENEVTLVLKTAGARPTNMIIRSGKRKYVFDLIPSNTTHQDTIEIVGAYGGPEIEDSGAVLIDSSEMEGHGAHQKGGSK